MHDWDFALTDVGFQASRVEVLEVDFAPVRSACSAFGVGNMYSDTQTFLGCSTLGVETCAWARATHYLA